MAPRPERLTLAYDPTTMRIQHLTLALTLAAASASALAADAAERRFIREGMTEVEVVHKIALMVRSIFICLVVAAVSGCATPYRTSPGDPTASIQFASKTDGGTGWSYYLWVGATDAQCNPSDRGTFLANKLENSADPITRMVNVVAGEPLYFTMEYGTNYLSRERSCRVTGSFVPKVGKEYKALMSISNTVQSCNLGLVQREGVEEVVVEDLKMPEFVCNKDSIAGPMRNGQALDLRYEVQLIWVR